MSPARKGKGGLAARLKRMQDHGALAKTEKARPDTVETLLPGWERLDDFVWRRVTGVGSVCPLELAKTPLTPEGASVEQMVFLDIETTGLSGGAGTLAFLIGIGTLDGGELVVEQLFLSDYPGELEYLKLILDRFDAGSVYVTYNGKSFDTQVLRSRFVMNGLMFHFEKQIDLLHPSRKLWSSMLESCRLGCIEEHILGLTRELDVPGIMIPDIYFDFLKSGDPSELEPVFAHHLEDIVTLARLLAHLDRLLSRPREASADPFQLGRWLLETGFPEWEDLLVRAFDNGDRRAGHLLGYHFRRSGDVSRAVGIWRKMYNELSDRRAAFELAKYYEHREKDFELAGSCVDFLLETAKAPGASGGIEGVERLEYRLDRIRKKAERRNQRPRAAE